MAARLVRMARDQSPVLTGLLAGPDVDRLLSTYTEAADESAFAVVIPGASQSWPVDGRRLVAESSTEMWDTFVGSVLSGRRDDTLGLYASALGVVRDAYPEVDVGGLILALWRHHWLLDFRIAGDLLMIVQEQQAPESTDQRVAAVADLRRSVARIRRSQRIATLAVQWSQTCFDHLPRVDAARKLLALTADDEARKYLRLGDEMVVDLRIGFAQVAASALFPDRPLFRRWLDAEGQIKRRDLRHSSHARFEAPRQCADMRGSLSDADRLRVLAELVAISAEAGWANNGTNLAEYWLHLLTDTVDLATVRAHSLQQQDDPPDSVALPQTNLAAATADHPGSPLGHERPRPRNPFAAARRALRRQGTRPMRDGEVRVLLFARLVTERAFFAVAHRFRREAPVTITSALTRVGQPRLMLTAAAADRSPTNCRHPECALGPRVSGQVQVVIIWQPEAVLRVIAELVTMWVEQAEHLELLIRATGVVFEDPASSSPDYHWVEFQRRAALLRPYRPGDLSENLPAHLPESGASS